MAGIFTRAALNKIMLDADLTPEARAEKVFGLYGQALDADYISKTAAAQAQATAVEAAKEEALKSYTPPKAEDTEEYKKLAGEYAAYKAMQTARGSEDYKGVKPKFFETVYGMIDRADGAKPVSDQLKAIAEKYEEYFTAPKTDDMPPGKPSFGAPTQGGAPTGKAGESFLSSWGFPAAKK